VLDLQLPGMDGLDVQRELARSGDSMPIIFLTGHGDIPMSVRAMKAGAIEFLTKPFREQDLLDAIRQAIDRDRMARAERRELAELRRRYDALTPRERDVMSGIVAGLLNKQIAARLGTSEATVKEQRGQVMLKMEAGSLAELVRTAGRLGIPHPGSDPTPPK
jgi:FixJ family two-component response regulator